MSAPLLAVLLLASVLSPQQRAHVDAVFKQYDARQRMPTATEWPIWSARCA